MPNISIIEHLTFLFSKGKHQLLQNCSSFLVQKRADYCLANRRFFCSEKRNSIVESNLIFNLFIVGLSVMKIFIEDNTNDDLVIFNRNSPMWNYTYLLIAYFQRVDTTSSSFLLSPYSMVLISIEAFHLERRALCYY